MLYVVTLEVVETVVEVGNSAPIRALTTAALTKPAFPLVFILLFRHNSI
jgi:hypothetical protein